MNTFRQHIGKILGVSGFTTIYLNKHKIYDLTTNNILNKVDPELAHSIIKNFMSNNLYFKYPSYKSSLLTSHVFDKEFKNPIGLAAGFDKDADMIHAMSDMGFGFIEVGTVLKNPNPGNKLPRIFKNSDNQNIVNNMGLNSKGIEYVSKNLNKRSKNHIIGVNIGQNHNSLDPIKDYSEILEKIDDYADYIVLNISCPNTSTFDKYKKINFLSEIIKHTKKKSNKPILLKISPDINYYLLCNIVNLSLSNNINGIIVSNTLKTENGGLSGKAIESMSSELIKTVYKLSNGQIPIIGCGGVFSGDDAYRKIKNGASLIQIYTSFIYNGPKVIYDINKELDELLLKDGYSNISQCVGTDVNLEYSYTDLFNDYYNYLISYWK